jgi:hypothetical protein
VVLPHDLVEGAGAHAYGERRAVGRRVVGRRLEKVHSTTVAGLPAGVPRHVWRVRHCHATRRLDGGIRAQSPTGQTSAQ